MKYPAFYNQVENIVLYDPLSEFLGAFDDGIIEFTYLDVVKSAGHSCPTVAGAYLVVQKALKALYKDELPLRGGLKITIKGHFSEGVNGVIFSVFSQITGSSGEGGFKGIGGKFSRKDLIYFNNDISGEYQFERMDNGEKVNLVYQAMPPKPEQQVLMQKIMGGQASPEEKEIFKDLWQDRVARILLEHHSDESVIRLV